MIIYVIYIIIIYSCDLNLKNVMKVYDKLNCYISHCIISTWSSFGIHKYSKILLHISYI